MTTAGPRLDAYRTSTSSSARLHERASTVMPGGNSRTTVHLDPYPAYAARGQGATVVDVEGQERLDCLNNYTSLMHGHADPDIIAAVEEQLKDGTAFGMPTPHEVALAELLAERVPSIDAVRFTNSGTESVMVALQAARAYSGRPKIAKFEGCYHGTYDFAAVSTAVPEERWDDELPPSTPYAQGTPEAVLEDVLVLRYNDIAMMERMLERHKDELAAVIVDPMPWRLGVIPGEQTFLERLREVTHANGIVLIFDEVIAFRTAYGGTQELVGVTPDLTTLAKIIGGGFPVGAVGGSAGIMSVFDPRGGKPKVPHGGTFSANPVTMVAGLTAMQKMTREEYQRLDELGAYVRDGLAEAMDGARVPGQVTGRGSLFGIHLNDRPLSDFRSWYGPPTEPARREAIHNKLLEHGVLMASALTGCLSTPMDRNEADQLVDAFAASLRDVRE